MPDLFLVQSSRRLARAKEICRKFRAHGVSTVVAVSVQCEEDYTDWLSWTDAIVVCDDFFSTDAWTKSLADYSGQQIFVERFSEGSWPALVAAALRLAIRLHNLDGQLNCRIKPRMRARLRDICPIESAVVQADSHLSGGLDIVLDRIGLPCVLKPIWGTGSDYVSIVHTRPEAYQALRRTFAAVAADSRLGPLDDGVVRWDPRQQLLIEEFVGGVPYYCSGFVHNGRTTLLLVVERCYWERFGGLTFETGCLVPPPALEPSQRDSLLASLSRVVSALELDNSFFHIECTLRNGIVGIIEVNSRAGGGSMPSLLRYFCDCDVTDAEVALHLGRSIPHLSVDRGDGFLLGVSVFVSRPGVFTGLAGLDWVHSQPEFMFEMQYLQSGILVNAVPEDLADRRRCMYCYDVFYWCTESSQAAWLHAETRRHVKPIMETPREHDALGSNNWRSGPLEP